ncbi:hypothetical protein, partial [Staphylococcus argensis]|uniref:hypothetical protein n=1 Tax=Staphylococcus argensis TaxID=1607738 RepID=UPI001C92E2B7
AMMTMIAMPMGQCSFGFGAVRASLRVRIAAVAAAVIRSGDLSSPRLLVAKACAATSSVPAM